MPQLATLVKTAPDGDQWLHEMKFDGYRIGSRVERGAVVLLSRNGKDWTASFPEVRDAVARLPVRQALLDGEVAAVLPDGRTSFQALQNVGSAGTRPVLAYFVFDLLHLDGEDVASQPLEARKARLEQLLAPLAGATLLRYSSHVRGGGRRFFEAACARGLEGIISKRSDLPYEPGRHGGWVKAKCIQRQELVIGGFTEPEGSRRGLGALLVGVHDERGALVFAGKVGTGFSQRTARDLRDRLDRLEQSTSPFANTPREWRRWRAHWVRPRLVAEVAFTEWTEDGRLRHPSFQGLRADKTASDVVRERPTAPAAAEPAPPPRTRPSRQQLPASPTAKAANSSVTATARGSRKPAAVGKETKGAGVALSSKRRATATTSATAVAGIRLSHPERVLYPDLGVSKLELARFYEAIAEWIVPHVAGRPLTLVRCPTGLGGCFYMKHTKTWAPEALRQVAIQEKTKVGDYVVADTVAGVVALVQMNVLEIHTWNSSTDHLERPDRIIIDLDPGPETPWPEVIEAARLVRGALETLGLASFVKTTGGKGLHVVAPLVPERDWDTCLAFARGVAAAIVREDPRRYTIALAKKGRERKILLDYLRNNRGSTAVAAFSTRARPGAPVSVPLAWDELGARLRSDRFHVRNLRERLRRLKHDPWREYWTTRQRISAKALAAVTDA